jgi:hypothetical protein
MGMDKNKNNDVEKKDKKDKFKDKHKNMTKPCLVNTGILPPFPFLTSH